MITRIERWGDKLAVCIPAALAAESGLAEDSPVDLTLLAGKIVITPAPGKSLAELLRGITPENRHGEWETGSAVGREEL